MPRRYSMETRAAAASATRDRLIDAALEVVARNGADAVTMQAVAETADVALRTLYNHFSSREELLTEAAQHLTSDTREPASAIMGLDVPADEKLLAFVSECLRSYHRQGTAAAVLMRAQFLPEVEARITEMRAWRRTQLRSLARQLDKQGRLRLPPKQAVGLLFTLSSYASWSSLVNESGLGPEDAVALVRHIVETAVLDGREADHCVL